MESFYRLDERPSAFVLAMSSLQWFIFMVASVITVPIVLGPALGLSPEGTGLLIDRTLFVSGVIGLLQVLFGHRLPIVEGPAGMWWGVFVVLIQMARSGPGGLTSLRAELELGLVIAGVFYVLLASFSLVKYVQRLFTPIVTGTFMVLLSLQLAESMISGLLGLSSGDKGHVNGLVAVLSLILVALTVSLMMWGRGMVRNLAVLIGLIAGWILFGIFGFVHKTPGLDTAKVFSFPTVLPFGPMQFSPGIAVTALFTAAILLSNFITSIQAMGIAAQTETSPKTFRFGALITGAGTALTGLFGVVGNVPLASSASLVSLSRMASRLPFIVASAVLAVLGLLPVIGRFIATLPAPVGYAVLFTVFGQLLGFGLKDFKQLELNQRDLFVISLSLLSGVGMFFVPSTAWDQLPSILGYLVDNGLILGVALVLILEHIVFRKKETSATGA